MTGDSELSQAELEQYRQAAEDLRHFDSFIWQNTVTAILSLTIAGAAVAIRDISSGIRAMALSALAAALLLMWVALHKLDGARTHGRGYWRRSSADGSAKDWFRS